MLNKSAGHYDEKLLNLQIKTENGSVLYEFAENQYELIVSIHFCTMFISNIIMFG
jgi:hypothetical protein